MTADSGGTPHDPSGPEPRASRKFPPSVVEADRVMLAVDIVYLSDCVTRLEPSLALYHTTGGREAVEAAIAYLQAAVDTMQAASRSLENVPV